MLPHNDLAIAKVDVPGRELSLIWRGLETCSADLAGAAAVGEK